MAIVGADDATGIGAIDDIAIPILGIVCVGATAYHYIFEQGYSNKHNNAFQFKEHTKNARPSTNDKHTKRDPGGTYGVNKNNKRGTKNQKHMHPENPNKRRK